MPLNVSGEIGCHHLSADDEVVSHVAVSADSTTALAAVEETVYVLNLRAGKQFFRLQGHESGVTGVVPMGRWPSPRTSTTRMSLWDVRARRGLFWVAGTRDVRPRPHVGPEGTQAVSVSSQPTDLRRTGTCRPVSRLAASARGRADAGRFSPGRQPARDRHGRRAGVPVGPADGTAAAGVEECRTARSRRLAFRRDGQRVLAARVPGGAVRPGASGIIRGRRVLPQGGGAGPVKCNALAFCPDGERLLCGGGPVSETSREDPDVQILVHAGVRPAHPQLAGSPVALPGPHEETPRPGPAQLLKGELLAGPWRPSTASRCRRTARAGFPAGTTAASRSGYSAERLDGPGVPSPSGSSRKDTRLSSPLSSRARRSLPLRRRSTPSARRRSATWRLRRGSPRA